MINGPLVYGFFKDEMLGGHNNYDVLRWLILFFFFDIFFSFVLDPFSLTDGMLMGDLIDIEDLICYLFLSVLPLYFFVSYIRENSFAIMQAIFLYLVLFGWLPYLVELFFDDLFFFFFNSVIFFDYFFLYDEEDF